MNNPAERWRPEPLPSGSSREELQKWFADLRLADADVTQYAVGIVKKHFAAAGLELRPELEKSTEWSGFALYLSLMLGSIIDQAPKPDWVRELFAELVDFSLLNPSGSPDARLAQLLAQFIQWDPPRRGRFKALLPDKATPALKLIDEWEADERFRLEQGYI